MTTVDELQYISLSTERKKLVQFCIAEHTNDMPLLPIFPMSELDRECEHALIQDAYPATLNRLHV